MLSKEEAKTSENELCVQNNSNAIQRIHINKCIIYTYFIIYILIYNICILIYVCVCVYNIQITSGRINKNLVRTVASGKENCVLGRQE